MTSSNDETQDFLDHPMPSQRNDVKSFSQRKPTVIGIYGVSGCGKSFLLKQLRETLGTANYSFYDGSAVINEIVPGGLEAFQKLSEIEKIDVRKAAIEKIKKNHFKNGKIAIISGHHMLWNEKDKKTQLVCNESDLDTYTHIIYLDTPPNTIHDRRARDEIRKRSDCSLDHLHKWQKEEQTELRKDCYKHGILFSVIQDAPDLLKKIRETLNYFEDGTEIKNRFKVEQKIDKILAEDITHNQLKTVLIIDADKTLCADDTSVKFWEIAFKDRKWDNPECPLKQIFESKLAYSFTAFYQAMLLYEDNFASDDFDMLCEKVASETTMHADFLSLLYLIERQTHIRAVVVTCGIRQVWDKVLHKAGLSDRIQAIGGSRIEDGFIVTPEVKENVVTRLQSYGIKVWCFGDSVLDLPMLKKADRALVLVCSEEKRSRRMEEELRFAINNDNLTAWQVIIPSTAAPRLSKKILPQEKLSNHGFIQALVGEHYCAAQLKVTDATRKNATKILMTPMRNAEFKGPNLRHSHQNVGMHLALVFLSEIIGVEEFSIPHVQGRQTTGYRLLQEKNTLIVAVMRAGESMAIGINEAFPMAEFLHAKTSEQIFPEHLDGKFTIILVDSVVNEGKTMEEFIKHISKLHATIHIVVVIGVMQSQSIDKLKQVQRSIEYNQLSIIALRLSDNKFKGQGLTDTGNRLFNSTYRI